MSVSDGMNVARCPKCHALDVRPTRARALDIFALVLFRKLARCGTCKARFSTWLAVPADKPSVEKQIIRKKVRKRVRVKVRTKELLGNE
jgi:hypothetical protein